jgi:AcrR family transcriptional regulator
MKRTRRSSDERRAELTDAALDIIATRGVAALSTRSLAEHVGLSSGAMFRHFASIDALLDAVVARVESVLATTYPPTDLPPLERLERFVEARSTAVGRQVGILRLVLSEQFLLALPEQGSVRLSACVTRTRAFIQRCIREAQASGEFRSDVRPSTLAIVVMGTIQMLAFSPGSRRRSAAETRVVCGDLITLIQSPVAGGPKRGRQAS